ncbi:thiol reductase thioredoxin [Salipaludibacillus keqinensis]|uniref:Thiol reductase thioredoxin n=1 Tax=Salipaludibacillus keqinensis TaxID=2045207 RepID=A0A323TGK4_9BACI|nr:thioredoxin family protein [Salipaludibacillus keqinensis]PYZ93600.1 thiol reductase thioredoxin [Salipaludibacillus keqinensis]
MKKVIIFGSVIVLLFVAIAFLTSYQNQQQAEGNPFEKDRLHSETIDQLDDPHYQNIILPEELDEKLANEEDVTVYFYSGQCEFCNEATPILVPKAEEMDVDLKLYNILEFDQGWNDYNIEATPSIVHYENGEEAARYEGLFDEETYGQIFQQISDSE